MKYRILIICALFTFIGCGGSLQKEELQLDPATGDASDSGSGEISNSQTSGGVEADGAVFQDVTTLMGYVGGVGNRDGIGPTASFYLPYQLKLSKDGLTLYVVDSYNHAIRRVNTQTAETVLVAGKPSVKGGDDSPSGPATLARFEFPWGICLTAGEDKLFVSDGNGKKVRVIELTTGAVKTLPLAFGEARGVACHPSEDVIFVADDTTVKKIDVSNVDSPIMTPLAGVFNDLWDIAIDDDGDTLFVSENIARDIYKIKLTAGGNTNELLIASTTFPDYPGLAYVKMTDGTEYLYAITHMNQIRRFQLDAAQHIIDPLNEFIMAGAAASGYVNGSNGQDARFNMPWGITANQTNVYVADAFNHVIRRVDLSSPFATSTLAGNFATPAYLDGSFSEAKFYEPQGMTAIGDKVYLADSRNRAIRALSISAVGEGRVDTVLKAVHGYADTSDGDVKLGYFMHIAAVGGDLYVADSQNCSIRKVALNEDGSLRDVVTIAGGKPFAIGFVDGVGLNSRFKVPYGIIGGDNVLYVADTFNHAIRKIELSNFNVATIAGNGLPGFVDSPDGKSAQFNEPEALAMGDNYLYVADYENHRIRRVNLVTYAVDTLAGSGDAASVDGIGTAASLNRPGALHYYDGVLYVVEKGGQVIRKIDVETQEVTTIAGRPLVKGTIDGSYEDASFNKPNGLWYIPLLNGLVVSDADSYSIRWVQFKADAIVIEPNIEETELEVEPAAQVSEVVPCDLDTDGNGDGLPDSLDPSLSDYNGDGSPDCCLNPGSSQELLEYDFDNDGFSNCIEFSLSTSPLTTNDINIQGSGFDTFSCTLVYFNKMTADFVAAMILFSIGLSVILLIRIGKTN